MRFGPRCGWRRACRWQSDEADAAAIGRPPSGSPSRRLGLLQTRLAAAELRAGARTPIDCRGGKRLWRSRNHLDMTGMIEQEWRAPVTPRGVSTADGESGVIGGNLTIRVDETGRQQIKTPAALVERFAEHISISDASAAFHRADEWSARRCPTCGARATSASIPNEVAGSLTRPEGYATTTHTTRARGPTSIGVDLNVDHLAVCVLTSPAIRTGQPITIAMVTADFPRASGTGDYARQLPACSTTPSAPAARRSWWRTSTSPTRAQLVAKPRTWWTWEGITAHGGWN